MRFTATELGLSKGAVDVRDLWTGQSRTVADGIVTSRVEGHGVTLLRLREDKALDPTRG
jgi:hypothetical protein